MALNVCYLDIDLFTVAHITKCTIVFSGILFVG